MKLKLKKKIAKKKLQQQKTNDDDDDDNSHQGSESTRKHHSQHIRAVGRFGGGERLFFFCRKVGSKSPPIVIPYAIFTSLSFSISSKNKQSTNEYDI